MSRFRVKALKQTFRYHRHLSDNRLNQSGRLIPVDRQDPPRPPRNTLSRREKIEQLLLDDPHDVFLRYSLAMELRGEGNHDESVRLLDRLAGETPAYVPAFFMAAQQLAERGQPDAARDRLREGIEEARRQGDNHAAAEMSELLVSLGDAGEEDWGGGEL